MSSRRFVLILPVVLFGLVRHGQAGAAELQSEQRLSWDFPHFRAEEYAAASAVSVLALSVQFGSERLPDGSWNGGILGDYEFRALLRASSADSRHTAAEVSDVLWPAAQWYPLVDSLLVPLAFDRGNTEVAFQMTMLNWQAEGFVFLLTRASHRLVGRRRPSAQGCEERGDCPPPDDGGNASFVGGHASMAFAGAGLTCAHHQAMPLYGAGWDPATCAVAVAIASATGVLRIVADKHWTSDVVAGAGLGFGIGYGMPMLLHYSMKKGAPIGRIGKNVAIVPDLRQGSYGLGLIAAL